MTKQKFNYRFFLKPNGRVFMRVRWNSGKNETGIALRIMADASKWDAEKQRAIRNTNHDMGDEVYSARIINNEIEKAVDVMTAFFALCDSKQECPSVAQVKGELVSKLQPVSSAVSEPTLEVKTPSMESLYSQFVEEVGKENNWGPKSHYKYQQSYNLLKSYRQDVRVEDVNKKFLNNFKCWLVENGYKNSTINRKLSCLRYFFRWISSEGHPIALDSLGYKSNLKVPMKEVISLKYEEVLQFENYKFPESKQYLARVRDYFCFMCYTSLRYSDLKGLKKAAINDDCINMYSQKTKGHLRIPLVDHAVKIMERYIHTTSGEYVFQIPSSQKMNVYLKEAAKMAGLNREVMETTFSGTERIEDVMKLHESISCHDARRTFVCISLSLGIPESVVRSCTGHANHATMKPYIAISDETSKQELLKWEVGSVKNELYKILEDMTEKELRQVISYAKSIKDESA